MLDVSSGNVNANQRSRQPLACGRLTAWIHRLPRFFFCFFFFAGPTPWHICRRGGSLVSRRGGRTGCTTLGQQHRRRRALQRKLTCSCKASTCHTLDWQPLLFESSRAKLAKLETLVRRRRRRLIPAATPSPQTLWRGLGQRISGLRQRMEGLQRPVPLAGCHCGMLPDQHGFETRFAPGCMSGTCGPRWNWQRPSSRSWELS